MRDGLTEEKITVIEEKSDHYVIETADGRQLKAYKIKKDEIQKIHDELNRKVAENLGVSKLRQLLIRLEKILSNPPTVIEYEDVVVNLTAFLGECYDEVGNPNQFHHPIKNINPDIYGRANTLMKQVKQLWESMIEVAQMMKEMGKIQEIHTTNIDFWEYKLLVRSTITVPLKKQLDDLSQRYRYGDQDIKRKFMVNTVIT